MNEQETEVFAEACKRLKIAATKSPALFDVSRQTFSSWIHGKSKVPHTAFVTLLAMENRAYKRDTERLEEIARIAEQISRKPHPAERPDGKRKRKLVKLPPPPAD